MKKKHSSELYASLSASNVESNNNDFETLSLRMERHFANAAKVVLLGVPKDLLDRHGAVSPEVARAMASGAKEKAGADIGIGVTGVAGPGGGSEGKPIGLVHFGVALPDGADLVLDLVGGDALRAVAPAAVKPDRVLSAADADTVTALGGTPVRAGVDDLEKITGVVSYEVVDPLVVVTYPLDRTNEALDLVESGTVRGNVVVEVVTPARAV